MFLRSRLAIGALAVAFGITPFFTPPVIAQSPPATGETIPDLDALIRDMREKGPRCLDQLGDFTMTFTFYSRKLEGGKRAKEESQTFEVFVPESYRSRKSHFRAPILLIARNGEPVSPDKLAKEREKLTRELNEFERDPDHSGRRKNGVTFSMSGGAVRNYGGFKSQTGLMGGTVVLSPSLIVNNAEFGAGRREMLNGRDTLVLEFRVKPELKLDREVAYVRKVEGVVWIDVQDRTLARLEGWQRRDSLGGVSPSVPRHVRPHVYFEQIRVADGIWFPRRLWLRDDETTTMFKSIKYAEVGVEYENYRRFRTEIIVTDEEEKK